MIASEFKPMWRERELLARPYPVGPDPTIQKGQLPTPSETTTEPIWRLNGVHVDREAEEELERRMEEMESQRLEMQEEEDLYLQEEAIRVAEELEEQRREWQAYVEEEEQLEKQEDYEQVHEEYLEEVESAVRELRSEALEQVLRDVESDMHALHVTSLKVRDAQVDVAEEMYMRGVEEEQELEQEDQEEQRMLLLLRRMDDEERMLAEAAEAQRREAAVIRRRERKVEIQEEEHDVHWLNASNEIDKIARREEQIVWDADKCLLEDSTEGAAARAWGGLRKLAERKHQEMTRELEQRHDMFAERLRAKIEALHLEGEKKRREEWASGGKDFSGSKMLLDSAALIRDHFEEHISMLDEEYKGIVERRDLWPPEVTSLVKHPMSAGAFRTSAQRNELNPESPLCRPSTAPRRLRSARERDRVIREGRCKAPTGFSHGIRAVFEALDVERQGYISQDRVSQSFEMLGLAIARDDLMAMLDGGRVDYERLESMVLESIGDGTTAPGSLKAASTSP